MHGGRGDSTGPDSARLDSAGPVPPRIPGACPSQRIPGACPSQHGPSQHVRSLVRFRIPNSRNSRGPQFPGPIPGANSRGLSLPARKIQNSQFPQFPGPVPPSTQFPGPVPPSMLSLPACCPSQHVPPSNCRCRSLPGQVCEGQTGLRGTGPAELGTGPARSGPCEVCAELGTGPAEFEGQAPGLSLIHI